MSLGSTLQIFSDPINPSVTSNDIYNLISVVISTTTFSPFAAISLCRVAGLAETFPSFPLGGPFLPDVPSFRVPSDSIFPLQLWSSSKALPLHLLFHNCLDVFCLRAWTIPNSPDCPSHHSHLCCYQPLFIFNWHWPCSAAGRQHRSNHCLVYHELHFHWNFLVANHSSHNLHIYIKCFKINVLLIIPSSLSEPMFLQGAAGQSSNPLYAKDTDVCVPNVVPTTWQTIRTDESMIETVFKSEVNFTTAYSGYSTRKIIMEERNVYCGAYNVLMLMEKWVSRGEDDV